jgi:hypothetical protein
MKRRFRPMVRRQTMHSWIEWSYGVLDAETDLVTYAGTAKTFKDARKRAKEHVRRHRKLARANRGGPTTDEWTEV